MREFTKDLLTAALLGVLLVAVCLGMWVLQGR